jgi:hypothetical protein
MLELAWILNVCPFLRPGEDTVSDRTRKPMLLTGLALLAATSLLLLFRRGGRYLRLA